MGSVGAGGIGRGGRRSSGQGGLQQTSGAEHSSMSPSGSLSGKAQPPGVKAPSLCSDGPRQGWLVRAIKGKQGFSFSRKRFYIPFVYLQLLLAQAAHAIL